MFYWHLTLVKCRITAAVRAEHRSSCQRKQQPKVVWLFTSENCWTKAKNHMDLCQDRKGLCSEYQYSPVNCYIWNQFKCPDIIIHFPFTKESNVNIDLIDYHIMNVQGRPEGRGLCGSTLRNSGSLLSFCNGWDLSPGDQGRRPALSASATLPHYKLEAGRLHCCSRIWLLAASTGFGGIPSQSQTAAYLPSGLSSEESFSPVNLLLRKPLKFDLAFMNAALSVDFSTSWYRQLVMEKCELLSPCCQMKSMWEELCIIQACFTAHVLVSLPVMSPCS